MPSRRKMTRRPRRTRKSGGVSLATKRYVRRVMPKQEMKCDWFQLDEQAQNTLSQGTFTLFPSLTPGVGADGRISNEISARGMHMKGVLYNNSTSESYLRQVVIGYAPPLNAMNNFFHTAADHSTGAVTGVNGLDAMYYPLNTTQLTVYYDKVFKLAGSATGNGGANTRMFSKFLKLGGKKLKFAGADNAPENWTYALIHIAADANDDTSTGTSVEVSATNRFYYSDN